VEWRAGIEPASTGFADRPQAAWVPPRKRSNIGARRRVTRYERRRALDERPERPAGFEPAPPGWKPDMQPSTLRTQYRRISGEDGNRTHHSRFARPARPFGTCLPECGNEESGDEDSSRRPFPRCSPDRIRRGGVEGSCTPGLVVAIHALSSLSYDPLVVQAGYEPAAFCVSDRCSSPELPDQVGGQPGASRTLVGRV
jgi:hypothetical protein